MAAFLWHKVAAISGFSIWAVALNLVERSSSTSRMKAKCWTFTGITAIVAGTFGSHGFKPTDPVYKTVWQTGNLYHLVHTSALLVAPYTKRPHLVQFGSLLTFGIAAFSGTYQKNTKNGYSSHVGCMSWH
uniref:Transmembrane protein 256 homolog n=1 Tax=Physcomitrium patens TaxID=3218 RepID=A0A2K1J768_PHYPA|nr:hypothetical protein PHYPA_020478 [Physcomitrium patens]PNR37377.1 hypothetical protein PHYPA_020485 [Physcomitrium patens]